MTHQDAEQRELAELYVQRKLSSADSEAFEEHYFSCDACFEEVQSLENMRAAVRDAVRTGAIEEAGENRWTWLAPLAAAVVLAIGAGYLMLVREPGLRARYESELADARSAARAATSRAEDLERQAASRPAPTASMLPLLVLEAARSDDGSNRLQAPAGAPHVALWMEPPPTARGPFRVVVSLGATVVAELGGLALNAQGAVAISLPASQQRPGEYHAKLFAGAVLIQDYQYEVVP
ncbi:MAG: hypothetical protein R2729_02055 [Bryobacteraceae bacterium]